MVSLFKAVDCTEAFVGPKGLAPENIEGAKRFLDSVNGVGGEVLGLNSEEDAVGTGAGFSGF